MPAIAIEAEDLQRFAPQLDDETASLIIAGVVARAAVFAPCILDDNFTNDAAAKDILIQVCLRRIEGGAGALTTKSQTTGPYQRTETVDTRQKGRSGFQPEDINELQDLCRSATASKSAASEPVGSFAPSPADDSVYGTLWPRQPM